MVFHNRGLNIDNMSRLLLVLIKKKSIEFLQSEFSVPFQTDIYFSVCVTSTVRKLFMCQSRNGIVGDL